MDTKSLTNLENNRDLNAILSDLANLRADVAGLANSMAGATRGAAKDVQSTVSAEASRVLDIATSAGRSGARAVEGQVRAHPALSLLAILALGVIGSQILRR